MKILFLGFAKIKIMPYINFYLDSFKEKNHDINIVYWNRDLKEEQLFSEDYTYYEFKTFQNDNVNKIKKILPFFKYRKFVKQILKKQEFDRIVVLTTFPGIMLFDILFKKYRNKYIFDFRDSTLERFYPFKKLVDKLIKNSYATFTRSNGFRKFFLDMPNIYTSHNLLSDSLNYREIRRKDTLLHEPIRISFWGLLRDFDLNYQIINRLGNDKRFELNYYGRMQNKEIINYCEEKKFDNVFFHGEYVPEDRYKFASTADIIHNIYNDENMMLAVGNKMYDGPIFYIPQLCFKGTYMGEIVNRFGVGYECDPYEKDFAEQIINYYKTINPLTFYENCDVFLNEILKEYRSGQEVLESFLYGGKA